MVEGEWLDVSEVAAWLEDPGRAERCATFPVDTERVSGPGVYAWHGDDVADQLIGSVLGCRTRPLYVDQAGAHSHRAKRASGATLKSAVLRHHLHGSTQASSFRRSLGAVLWTELELRCERPRVLEAESNARLTAWMLEHLSVATYPVDDRSHLWVVGGDVAEILDPVFNLVRHRPHTPGRKQLRALRRRYFSLASADVERVDRFLKLRAFAASQEPGNEFLRRRLQQEQRRVIEHWSTRAR